MTEQNKKDKLHDQKQQNTDQKEQEDQDMLALDSDEEIEDLVDSIAEKERSLKTGKQE